MKRIIHTCFFLLLPFAINTDDGEKVKNLPMPVQLEEQIATLQYDAVLNKKKYSELLVSVLPQLLVDRIDQFLLEGYACPILLLNSQGLESTGVVEAFTQTQNIGFLCIDSKYFMLEDDTKFFSSIRQEVEELLGNYEDLFVVIDRVDWAGHDTKRSWRIDNLIGVLRKKPVMVFLTAGGKECIDNAIMRQVKNEDILDCGKLDFDARAKIIHFYFKEKIQAGIVDERLVQTIAENTDNFFYKDLCYMVNRINRLIDNQKLKHISDKDVFQFISIIQKRIDSSMKSDRKMFIAEWIEFIKNDQSIKQGLTIGIILAVVDTLVCHIILKKMSHKAASKEKETYA